MKITILSVGILALGVSAGPTAIRATSNKQVTDSQYASLVRYTKFAAAALASGCKTLYTATVVKDVANIFSDTQGYVARDDSTREIIIALRGTSSIIDAITDARTTLKPCVGNGIPYPSGALCHAGFMSSWNSVQDQFLKIVKAQVAQYPSYSITVVGHSLGGALTSFASLSMKYNFPSVKVIAYSFGEPRNGNKVFAAFHDAAFPIVNGLPTYSRAIHTTDGVPQVIRQGSSGSIIATFAGLILPTNNPWANSGYWHHGTEIWQFRDPANAANTLQCNAAEDSTCQNSVYIFAPLAGINSQHLTYFGQPMASIFCPK